jgi:1,2-diacylglycerol 3-alpha-glucosyltransferase
MNGQAVFTTNLAEGLAKRGHTVRVVVDSATFQPSQTTMRGVMVDALRSYGFNFFHANVKFSPFPGKQVGRLLEQFHPDIVHIQDHYPICWAATFKAKRRGIKIVGSNHFVPENVAPYFPFYRQVKPVADWFLWRWLLLVYRQVDAITAQSRAAATLIKEQGLRMPVLPISCGIDLEFLAPTGHETREFYCRRYGLDAHKKLFLFLGRIDGEKRVDLLLQAMRELKRDDVQLAVAGRGRVEKEMRQMAASFRLGERVHFTGYIPPEDIPGLLNSVDIFIMPSEAELLSISTLEAMACAKPVLLANALALPELVEDGVNGYLFKPGDVPDLVRLMNQTADQPERWQAMGIASREMAKPHSLEGVIDKFESLYTQLIQAVPVVEVKGQLKDTI